MMYNDWSVKYWNQNGGPGMILSGYHVRIRTVLEITMLGRYDSGYHLGWTKRPGWAESSGAKTQCGQSVPRAAKTTNSLITMINMA